MEDWDSKNTCVGTTMKPSRRCTELKKIRNMLRVRTVQRCTFEIEIFSFFLSLFLSAGRQCRVLRRDVILLHLEDR